MLCMVRSQPPAAAAATSLQKGCVEEAAEGVSSCASSSRQKGNSAIIAAIDRGRGHKECSSLLVTLKNRLPRLQITQLTSLLHTGLVSRKLPLITWILKSADFQTAKTITLQLLFFNEKKVSHTLNVFLTLGITSFLFCEIVFNMRHYNLQGSNLIILL